MRGHVRYRLVRGPLRPAIFGDEYRQLGIYAKRYT